jgi:D-alanyl-D-alanine carboxypeptidase
MKIGIFIFAAAVFASDAPMAHAQRGNPEVAYAGSSVDAMIAAFMKENEVPGMAIAIVQAPYITRVEGFGLADKTTRTLVSSNTIFDIAQMRNAFTAVAVMQLVEAGKLSLDDTLRSRLLKPESYPELEALVEKTSGESYEDFVRKHQFEALGLQHTFFRRDLEKQAREKLDAGGRHSKFLHEAGLINPTEPASGYGGDATPDSRAIYSSGLDVSIWDVGLAGDILVKDPAHRKLLYQPHVSKDGKKIPTSGPWVFPGHEGLMVATGSAGGFSSLLSRFTKSDELVCVTLLANKEGLDLTQLARKIAGAYNPKIGPPLETAAMRTQQSPYSVAETIDRLERILRERGVGIIARVDHSKAAESAKLELRPTEELIFGNPAAGTLLMQSNPAVTVDLPLRAAAWERDGEVWLAATDPVEIAERHGIKDRDEVALKMRAAIDSALLQAVSPD